MIKYGLLTAALALAACTAAASDDAPNSQQDQGASTIDRLILGQASAYTPDLTLAAKSDLFASSMAERRKMAWDVVQRVVSPVGVDGLQQPIPRFQTWYSQEEILPMFAQLFGQLSPADQKARAPFTTDAINAVYPWNVTRATSLASFTQQRLAQRKAEMATAAGEASLGMAPRVLMSPDYTTHLFQSYSQMFGCKPNAPVDPSTNPADPTDSQAFAPCLAGEFPAGAVAVKSRWMPDTSPVPVYDTSAASITARVSAAPGDPAATYSDQGDSQANPTASQAYTMQLDANTTEHLVALHIITKELRDWVWITMWWSPDANSDFGADRPDALNNTIFANYKMCVVTSYQEGDPNPGNGFPQSLSDAINAGASAGPSTWCSNPYLETADHAAKTNCIGCHQNGGTGETTDTILAQDAKFPDNARQRVRPDFPADYAFTTTGGLDITDQFLDRVQAVSP